ncbi:uncharacterized protein MONBRDRAFT_32251 [Monosiga brevicollis MX1]|uniref:BZIP domain-containing protein n=1 Tax=Monosiga brevicollis TaxID=81824 RepID=A9UYD1_MONBE|nr:uncharacterized protein MONBRDRAFT_32251 [Monosiga brevicollis MX1]EDQ89442.1 predicted protein [Monosiga brevicollis MX1]|eukprot:XP_001745471.1 hypothetical protein [Monosiga brevicollis MX1]
MALQEFDFSDWYAAAPQGSHDLSEMDFGSSLSSLDQSKANLTAELSGETTSKRAKTTDKKQLNKQAADRYRRKKRQQFEELQSQSSELADENKALSVKCERLENEVAYLKDLLMTTIKTSQTAPATAQPSLDGLDATVDPAVLEAVPPALHTLVKTLVNQRRSVMEARFAALEEKIAHLAAKCC